MTLFHPRIIKRITENKLEVPQDHARILSGWGDSINDFSIFKIKETALRSDFIHKILAGVLGYDTVSSKGTTYSLAEEYPLGSGSVDVAFGTFDKADKAKDKVLAPFELKGAKTKDLDAIMPGRNKSPVQQAWEYGMDAKGAKWVLVTNYTELRLYAIGYGRKSYESFDFAKISDPEHYTRFVTLLAKDNLLGGHTFNLLKESEQVDKDITKDLYDDYKALRARLIKTIGDENPGKDPLDVIRHTQTILDRILFIAFAEDKKLLPENTLQKAYETKNPYNPQPVWENFRGLFHAINKGNKELEIPGYNGGLFADDEELDSLKISDELCEGFKKIGEYDFDSDVSVNILGHIFEQSISDLEELKAHAENVEEVNKKQSKRKKDGIYYTPASVTRYIVEQAVGGWLNDRKKELGVNSLPEITEEEFDIHRIDIKSKNFTQKITQEFKTKRQQVAKKVNRHIEFWEAYEKALSNITVLDPACGSGAFLNEVFDFLKAEGEAVNGELANLKNEQISLFRWDTHILANNIYGVDLNSESIEITKLSLWLKTANRQEKLTYLEDNIKVGNSLIDDSGIAGSLAFNWNEKFSDIMQEGGFDVVVGNPPWGAELSKPAQTFSNQKFYSESTKNIDSYGLFFGLSLSNLKTNGLLGFITPDTFLRKNDLFPVREKLLKETNIIELIETGPLFKEVRDTWCAITICNKSLPDQKLKTIHKKIDRFVVSVEERESHFQKQVFSSVTKLNQKIWEKSDSLIVGYIANEKTQNLIFKLGKNKRVCDYKKQFEISRGEEGSKSKFKEKKQSGFYLVTPEEVFMNYVSQGTEIEKNTVSEGKLNKYYTFPKIWIIRIQKLRWKQRIVSALDERTHSASTKTLQLIVSKNNDLNLLKALQAVLSSKIVNFWCSNYLSDDMNQSYLEQIPFFDFQKKDYSDLSGILDETLNLNKEFFKVKNTLRALLMSEFSMEKTSRKLENWFKLDFSEFVAEIEKSIKPVKLSLSKKSEWMEHFEKEKAKALELKNKIEQIDRKRDQMIYELYELTPEEIELVEKAQ